MPGKPVALIRHEPPPVPRLALSAAEGAESLGVSERHLDRLPDLPWVRLGHRRVLPIDLLQQYLRDQFATQRDVADQPASVEVAE